MRTGAVTFALAFSGLVACDDANPIKPPVDGPGQTADAAMFKGFEADEGGEVRYEYVNFPNGNAAARVTAFFYKTAGSHPRFPLLNLDGCTDTDKSKGFWPSAQNPQTERQYIDPGLVLISGGPATFTARRNAAAGKDAIGRDFPAGQATFSFGGSTANDASMFMTEKTSYSVTLTGSADLPSQTFKDAIWIPANYMITTPPFDASYALKAHQDVTFNWTVAQQTNLPPDRQVLSVVVFTGPNGVSTICVKPDTGSITIPAALVDAVATKYPTGGVLARQTLTHVVRELVDNNGPTGRRIDMIGVWCNSAPFTVVP
jgi:hypothetical protein